MAATSGTLSAVSMPARPTTAHGRTVAPPRVTSSRPSRVLPTPPGPGDRDQRSRCRSASRARRARRRGRSASVAGRCGSGGMGITVAVDVAPGPNAPDAIRRSSSSSSPLGSSPVVVVSRRRNTRPARIASAVRPSAANADISNRCVRSRRGSAAAARSAVSSAARRRPAASNAADQLVDQMGAQLADRGDLGGEGRQLGELDERLTAATIRSAPRAASTVALRRAGGAGAGEADVERQQIQLRRFHIEAATARRSLQSCRRRARGGDAAATRGCSAPAAPRRAVRAARCRR